MAMMMGAGGDSNCGGGGDIDGGDDVFPIDVCLCHMQLTVWILMIVSHYLFLMFIAFNVMILKQSTLSCLVHENVLCN